MDFSILRRSIMTNKFIDEFASDVLSEAKEDLKNSTSSVYELSDELLEKDWDFDTSAIYIPYTFKHERNADTRDIYLRIERIPNQKKDFMLYSWTSKEGDEYRKLNSFRRNILLTEEDIDTSSKSSINRKLSHLGRIAKLDSGEGSYKGFFESLLIDVVNAPCLDVFKELDFDFPILDDEGSEELEVSEIEQSIQDRRCPTLDDKAIAEASEVENTIKDIGAIAYLENIVDKFHIGNHKNIYRKHIGGFNIIRGKGAYLMGTTAKSGEGKSLEDEIAILKLIPNEYIFKKNQMTLSSFSRYCEASPFYFDRMIVYFGDLGGRKSFQKVEDVFDVFKVLITEKAFSRDISEGTSKGGYETVSLTLIVESVGAVYQTVKTDFLGEDFEQYESRSIQSTPFEAKSDQILDLIFALKMEDSIESIAQREADKEVLKYHNYLRQLIAKNISIINPFKSVFKKLVKHSDIANRDLTQLLELFEGFCVLTYFDCKVINGKYIASQKQLKTFVNDICLDNTLAPHESDFIKMLIGIKADGEKTKYALTIIEESEDDELDSLQPYHNAVLEAIGEIQHLDKFQSLTIEGLEYSKRDKAISKLLEMFKLKGRSVNHEECVFFRVSDIKGAYSNIKAFKNIDDVGALLNKLYDKGFINKLDFYDNKRQNIYYLTSKCEEITSPIEITEDDIVEAQNFLIYQGVYEADKEEDKSNKS